MQIDQSMSKHALVGNARRSSNCCPAKGIVTSAGSDANSGTLVRCEDATHQEAYIV